MSNEIQGIVEHYQRDKTRLLDMLWDVQRLQGHISDASVAALADVLSMSPHDVSETLSFYHFYCAQPFGKHKIYLADTVIVRMNGYDEVREALQQATGCAFGAVDASGMFGLAEASCIGLSDQEPAMMIDEVVFTHLTAAKVNAIIRQLRLGKSAVEIACPEHYPTNSLAYVESAQKP